MSFPRYTEYEDSCIDWLGEVPRHWEVKRVRHLTNKIKAGPFGSSLTKDVYVESGYRVYGQEQVIPNDFTIGDYYISQEKYDELSQFSVSPGDVLISCVGTFGKIAIVPDDAEPGIINPRLLRLRCNSYIKAPYFLEVLASQVTFEQFSVLSRGGTMDVINSGTLGKVVVPVPPRVEQTAIASFLDAETSKIDALVAEQRRLIELLKEKRQAVISHAVTKGLNPDTPMKPSGIQWLGDVPEHWEVRRVKHSIETMEQGWSPQCDIEPVQHAEQWGVLKVGCVNYGKFNEQENKALPSELTPKPELGIKKGDLFISRAHTIELVGSAAVAENDYANLMLCDKLYRLRMNSNRLLPEFLCFFLSCEFARKPIELGATGASPSMKNIAQSVITELWFATPGVEEQRGIIGAIDRRRSKLNDLMMKAEAAIELLQERRTALISAAVTGKIDVRDCAYQETA